MCSVWLYWEKNMKEYGCVCGEGKGGACKIGWDDVMELVIYMWDVLGVLCDLLCGIVILFII